MSKDILHDLRKLLKKEILEPEYKLYPDLNKLLTKRLQLPANFMEDITEFLIDCDRSIIEEKTSALCAVLEGEYTEEDGLLTDAEWLFVRDLASEFGEVLPLDTLTTIMQNALQYGAFE